MTPETQEDVAVVQQAEAERACFLLSQILQDLEDAESAVARVGEETVHEVVTSATDALRAVVEKLCRTNGGIDQAFE